MMVLLSGLCAQPTLGCPGGPLKVAIDVGHSRAQPGATSASGRVEYDFNERFSRELVDLSRRRPKLSLFILNPHDRPLSLSGRSRLAASKGAHVLVSIHHDSAHRRYMRVRQNGNGKQLYTDAFRGFSLFVSSANTAFSESHRLASLIGRWLKDEGLTQTLHHAEPIEGEGRTLLDWGLGIYDAPFVVLRTTRFPAVLLEVGVIANPTEERLLDIPEHRERVASAVLAGLEAFCAGTSQ